MEITRSNTALHAYAVTSSDEDDAAEEIIISEERNWYVYSTENTSCVFIHLNWIVLFPLLQPEKDSRIEEEVHNIFNILLMQNERNVNEEKDTNKT